MRARSLERTGSGSAGIELEGGMRKLVRWTKKTFRPQVLASAELKLIFERAASTGLEAAPLTD